MADKVVAMVTRELASLVTSWPWTTLLLQIATAVWAFVVVGVIYTRAFALYTACNRFADHALGDKVCRASAVIVNEVSSHQLRGGTKRFPVLTSGATSSSPCVVRSVDIQPASTMEMRVRVVQLSSSATKQTTLAVHGATRDAAPSADASRTQDMAGDIHSKQCAASTVDSGRGASKTRVTPSSNARIRLNASGWMLLFLSAFTLCAHSAVANAEAVSGYIVLVSIPILDKVLPLKNLADELLHRGYRVGFALPENYRTWVSDIDRLEFISLGPISSRSRNLQLDENALQAVSVYDNYATTLRYYASFQGSTYTSLVEEFEDDRPSLVIVDRYTFGGFDACHALGIPYVVNSPSLLRDIDGPPAYIPAPFSNFTTRTPSVWDRCLNSVHRLRFRLATVQVFREINHVRSEHRLPPVDFKEDLIGHHLVLVNSVFGMDEARPLTPQFQMVGMLERVQERVQRSTLMPDFAWWVASEDHASKPLVYLSFAGEIPLAPELLSLLLDGLETVNARIVCRLRLQEDAAIDLRSRARSSVYFVSGSAVDEFQLLQLAPISVMVTAGDFVSIQHALDFGIPVVGVPVTAEQLEAVAMVQRTGAGVQLHRGSLTQEMVYEAVTALLQKPQFAAAAFRLGEVMKTGGGTKRAADHVESVLSFGVKHIVPMRNLQPLYKTYLVDVYLIYGAILFCSVVVLRTCFAIISSILQLAPEVHLGMNLDDELPEDGQVDHQDHADVHKHAHAHHKHSHGQHSHQHHAHHSHSKVKDV